jgi:hypothetical protein
MRGVGVGLSVRVFWKGGERGREGGSEGGSEGGREGGGLERLVDVHAWVVLLLVYATETCCGLTPCCCLAAVLLVLPRLQTLDYTLQHHLWAAMLLLLPTTVRVQAQRHDWNNCMHSAVADLLLQPTAASLLPCN